MSDGMSDGAALGRLEQELDTAAHAFAEALLASATGHRGWAIPPDLHEINRALRGTGFKLIQTAGAPEGVARAREPLSTRLAMARTAHQHGPNGTCDCLEREHGGASICMVVRAALDALAGESK